jgi:hypothetical protein
MAVAVFNFISSTDTPKVCDSNRVVPTTMLVAIRNLSQENVRRYGVIVPTKNDYGKEPSQLNL